MLTPTNHEDTKSTLSLTVECARLVRADRIVAAKSNPADKARERGYRDCMLGLPSRRAEYSLISQVTYDQGVTRAKRLRDLLRGKAWTETDIVRSGSSWDWAFFVEGTHIASGSAKTEKAASQAAEDAAMNYADRRALSAA